MHATACTIPQRAGGEPPLRDVTSERQRERPGPDWSEAEVGGRKAAGRSEAETEFPY